MDKIISIASSPKIIMAVTLFLPSMLLRGDWTAILIPAMTIIALIVVKILEHYRESDDLASFEDEDARQVRYTALVLGTVCFILASGIAQIIDLGHSLSQFYFIAGVVYFMLLVATVAAQTRLSLHASSVGLFVLFLLLVLWGEFVPALWAGVYLFLLIPVAWSRISMRKHTVGQVLVSTVLTVVCVIPLAMR